ncbi:MAG TPA: FMN-binding negative transcriptional regulator [Terriglobia bacterium]|nr:FMN-binding negative transcriptional regulator [Terriglobia bacterium]
MYLPKSFEETRVDVLHDLIRAHPLGTLVTLSKDGLDANHIPFGIDSSPAPFGILRGHVARANSIWNDQSRNSDALAIFQGPHTYVSPSWYATKMETGMVVPTWNYVVVHAHGELRAIEDLNWLRNLVDRLTTTHEADRQEPWKMSDAPSRYIDRQLAAIVGLELTITRLVGKWKISQNRSKHDRASVIRELTKQGGESSVAMARLIDDATEDAT